MWNAYEDKELVDIVRISINLTWNQIALELAKRLPETTKTGKQCRERYRNYLNPILEEKIWTKSERILFLLLHCKYGNHWGNIAKYYFGRSDISIKNLFYCYFRRTLKKIRDGIMPLKVLQKSRKVLETYHVLDLIELKYLPTLRSLNGKQPGKKHEKVILQHISENNFDEKKVKKMKSNLIHDFKTKGSKEEFPIIIKLDIDDLNFNSSKIGELESIIKDQSFGELSKYIRVETVNILGHKPQPLTSDPIANPLMDPFVGNASCALPCIPRIPAPFYTNCMLNTPGLHQFHQMKEYLPISIQSHATMYNPIFAPSFSYTNYLQNQQYIENDYFNKLMFNYGGNNETGNMGTNNRKF